MGADLRKILLFDTFLAEWVLAGNLRVPLSLEESCLRRGVSQSKGHIGRWIRLGINPESVPKKWLTEYCATDVAITQELFTKQITLLEQRNQLHLVYQRGLVCACLADIEFSGMALDKEAVYEEHEKTLSEYVATKEALEAFASINWRSPKQVGEFIYDTLRFEELRRGRRGDPVRTAAGARSTAAETLSALVASSEEQRNFLRLYKKQSLLSARLSKTLDFFKGVCDKHECVFYGIFNQGNTATHRLSSSGRPILLPRSPIEGSASSEPEKPKQAQFQNLPREYKRLLRAKRKGWLILEADESQLEFRVAAELGTDEVALSEIKTGVDIHSITAKALTEAGEPSSRQDAKSRTFRPLYGGSSGSAAERAYCKFFQNKYQGIFQTQTGWTKEVLKSKDGELTTPYGMRFYWPGTDMSRSGYIDNTTSIFNFPIQGFATAEIVPLALVAFWHRTEHLDVEVVNTVHDSIVAEVSPEHAEEVKRIAEHCLTTDVYYLLEKLYNYKFQVPLNCEIKIGERWGEDSSHK